MAVTQTQRSFWLQLYPRTERRLLAASSQTSSNSPGPNP